MDEVQPGNNDDTEETVNSEITESKVEFEESEDNPNLKLSSDENEFESDNKATEGKKIEIPKSVFQKLGSLFGGRSSKEVVGNEVESSVSQDKTANENVEDADIEHSAQASSRESQTASPSVGLRPRRSRPEGVKEAVRARKSIGRSPSSTSSSRVDMQPLSNAVPGTVNATKTRIVSKFNDPSKPRRKRKFKGGTYSLFLSKRRKAKVIRSPKKDPNKGEKQSDDDDSEDEDVSVTDSMVTLDSSHEDDSEIINIGEELENADGSSLSLSYQDVDENISYTEDVASDAGESNQFSVDNIDDNKDCDEILDIDKDNEEIIDEKIEDTSFPPEDDEDLSKEDYLKNDECDVENDNLVIDEIEADDVEEKPSENQTENDSAVEDIMDGIVEKVSKENVSVCELNPANVVSTGTVKQDDEKMDVENNEDKSDNGKVVSVQEPRITEKAVEVVNNGVEVKKSSFKLLLRPAFKSLLKSGSKSVQSAQSSRNGEKREQQLTDSCVKIDQKSEDCNISNKNDDDDGESETSQLIMNGDVTEHELVDCTRNSRGSNEDKNSSDAVIQRMSSTVNATESPAKHRRSSSSIASCVKSRQRIKKKMMEDHFDMDHISFEDYTPPPLVETEILLKQLNEGLENMPSLSGIIGSPMLDGTSPLLSKSTFIQVQQGEGYLKKVTTCSCTYKYHLQSTSCLEKSPEGGNYCQAVDAMYGRIVACCNTVTKMQQMYRSSVRIPFMFMCELHRHRLRLHQCCPGCGLFCTEGAVLQCHTVQKVIHHFHKRCLINVGNKSLCPHCGESSQFQEVKLELNTPQPLNFYLSREPISKFPRAKMVITRSEEAIGDPLEEKEKLILPKLLKLPRSDKVISSAGVALGPGREQLEQILVNLSNRPSADVHYSATNFYTACEKGEIEKLIHMLFMNFDVNQKFEDRDNETCLHAACRNGHFTTVHILIQAGVSLDTLNDQLKPPMFLAIENDFPDIVNLLIRAGSDTNIAGEDGTTPLHLSAVYDRLECCRLILNSGIKPNIQDDGGWSPLVWAAEHGHYEIVKLLLERGADPFLQDSEQNIALHWAAFSGSVDISQLFIDRGCPLNTTNINGDTPLHIGARQNRYECVVLFLARHADVTMRNKENELPIDCCLDKDSQTWMALSMSKELHKLKSNVQGTKGDRIIHRDVSQGKENYPIQCVNSVDDEQLPTNYLYVVQNCETSPINIDRTIISLQSCNCEDDCTSPGCKCVQISLKCWYEKDGKLLPDFNFLDPPMLFECNRACRCWKNLCNNRVVQEGITCRLQLFKTTDRGWGVRTLKEIPKGSFVCEYIGELMSDSEADQREDDSYLFDLDNRDGETFCIDARYYGNISRFVNHLCEPNVVPVKVFIDHQDLSFPRIAFFSSRDIKPYEELGFDYGEKFWIIKYKWFTCTCATSKCKYSKDTIQKTLDNYNRKLNEENSGIRMKKFQPVLLETVVTNGGGDGNGDTNNHEIVCNNSVLMNGGVTRL